MDPLEQGAGRVAEDAAPEGVTGELMEPLLQCLTPGEAFVEYGVVEYRFRQRFADLFRTHVLERGHVLTGKTIATASSVRFGVALARLARDGEVLRRYAPATGAWSYNGQVTLLGAAARAHRRVNQLGVLLRDRGALRGVDR